MRLINLFPMAVLFLLFGVAAAPVFSQTLVAKGVQVIDGDTVAAIIDGKRERIRAVDYDAPDLGRFAACDAERALGMRARNDVRGLINLRGAHVEFTGQRDQYNRILAYFKVGSTSFGDILGRRGRAMPYSGGQRQWSARLCGVAQ